MKNYILIYITFLAAFSVKAQDVGFQWAGGFGNAGVEFNEDITTDEFGNVYMTGAFQETIDFDPGDGVYEITSAGSYDCFILKLNSEGELVWVKTIGGLGSDGGFGVKVNSEGNLIIIGNYREVVDFDPGIAVLELTAEESSDGFILELDSEGNFISVKTISGSTELPFELALDASDNIYITGTYSNTTDFNPDAGVYELSAIGEVDVFILKLNADGEFVWARSVGGGLVENPTGIDVDSEGNVYISGNFEGTIDLDPGPSLVEATSLEFDDAFSLKLDVSGNYSWHTTFINESANYAGGIIVDENDDIYIVGAFRNTIDFDPGVGIENKTSSGSSDCFIQKLDIDGDLVWVRTVGNAEAQVIYNIQSDLLNNIFLTGYFQGELDFDPEGDVFNLSAIENSDIFIQSMNSDGNFRWAKSMGGIDFANGREIAISNDGYVHITGEFLETVDFNPGLGEYPITSNGSRDFFVVKLSPCDASSSTDVISACNSYTWIDGLTYTEDNNTANVLFESIDGCDSIVTLDLTIIELDNGISSSGATLTSDDADATYQWLNCNEGYTEILGETDMSFTADEDGSYAVRVQQGECVDTSECITIAGVGITDENQSSDIKIFPNPSNGIVNVNLSGLKDISINVFTINGQLIYSATNLNDQIHSFQLDVESGIYIVEVTSNEQIRQVKLIVE